MSATSEFWERLPEETDRAFQAFTVYRDQGITRSLRKAAAAFYSQREGDQMETKGSLAGGTSGQVARFKAWSRKWMWVARCEAFDAEEARERSLRMQQRRIQMMEHHYAVGTLAMNRAAERLRNLGLDEELPKSVAPLIRAAADLQRLAVGEPTTAVDLRGAAPPHREDADASWLDSLSLEDKEELARIFGYLEDDDYLNDPNLDFGQETYE